MTILSGIFYFVGTIALAALAVHAWLAHRGDSRALFSTVYPSPSAGTVALVVFAGIALFVSLYRGALAMLGWIPESWGQVDEYGEFLPFSGLLATAFSLIVGYLIARTLDSATHNVVFKRALSEENVHLRELIGASLDEDRLRQLKEKFDAQISALRSDRIRSAGALGPEQVRLEHYFELVELVDEQQSRLRRAAENRGTAAAAAPKTESDAAKAAKVAAAVELVRHQVQSFLATWTATTELPVATTLPGSGSFGPCVLSPSLVEQRWSDLDKIVEPLLEISESDIAARLTAARPIDDVFRVCSGTRLIEGARITASYSGDSNGGHTAFHASVDGPACDYLDALRFGHSAAGAIEGLYFAFRLRQHGVYWHGAYGRDYTLLFTPADLAAVLQRRLGSGSKLPSLASIERPCGMRVQGTADRYRVSCLAAYPDETIVDLSVRIIGGRITVEPEDELSPSDITVLY